MDPFADRKLDTLTVAEFLALVDRAIPENIHLDYKLKLDLFCPDPKQQQKSRQNLLADVTAFANSQGGVIIYGIQESTGCPEGVPGFEITDPDEFKRTIESLFRDGIDERLPFAPEIHTCKLPDQNFILAIRVRRSVRQPHRVILGGHNGFYLRVNTQNQLMNTSQIRDSVHASATYLDKVEALVRDRRLQKASRNPRYWMLHTIPLERDHSLVDVTNPKTIACLDGVVTPGNEQRYTDGRFCLEGYRRTAHVVDSCITFFRDGVIEVYDSDVFHDRSEPRFPYVQFEKNLFSCLNSLLGVYRELAVSFPIAISLKISGIKDLHLVRGPWDDYQRFRELSTRHDHVFESNDIVSPLYLVNEQTNNLSGLVKPLLDIVWNAAGYDRCAGYDAAGVYVGYKWENPRT